MDIKFKEIEYKEIELVLDLFKKAAEKINKLNINHWQYWKNPPIEKLEWVKEGILMNEFYFVTNSNGETLGMVRVQKEDILYWGKQNKSARYVHSLVVEEKYKGKGIGVKILLKIEEIARNENCEYLRLDADSKNPKLCNYYINQGFVNVGSKKLPLSIYNLYEKKL